jgi:glycosyltransferase involved in cell wall biosynthesis
VPAPTSRRIRVVQAIYSMHIGGAEHAVVNIARGLDRERFEVAVCCTREAGVLADQLRSEGVDVVLAAPPKGESKYKTPWTVWRALRGLRPDVVHTHSTPTLLHVGPLGALGLLPPTVHTFHYGNYPLDNAREMRAEKWLSRRVSALIAVSNVQRDALIRYHALSPSRIETIVNGVAENPYLADPGVRARLRAEFGFAAGDVVVGCVAVLTRQKGIPHLLAAAARIKAARPAVRFLVAGGGPLERDLRAQAATMGLGDTVVFTGWRQDNLKILTALDVFVMASLWEAMPLALLEAMAARRPIVVTDVGENRRVVADGACGRVVPPADETALADAILGHLDDPAAAAAMGERAYQRFADEFRTDRMVRRYEAVYDRLAG